MEELTIKKEEIEVGEFFLDIKEEEDILHPEATSQALQYGSSDVHSSSKNEIVASSDYGTCVPSQYNTHEHSFQIIPQDHGHGFSAESLKTEKCIPTNLDSIACSCIDSFDQSFQADQLFKEVTESTNNSNEIHPSYQNIMNELNRLKHEVQIQKHKLDKISQKKNRKSDARCLTLPKLDGDSDSYSETDYVEETDNDESLKMVHKIFILQANNKEVHRKWDKVQYCVYCSNSSTNLTKHLLKTHSEEIDVQRIQSVPLKTKDRHILLEKLRNRGNYLHNIEVIRNGKGCIIPYRRPSKFLSYKEFTPCRHCLGFFKKDELWKHDKVCQHRKEQLKEIIPFRKLVALSSLLLPSTKKTSDMLGNIIFSHMNNDALFLIIKNDSIILRLGENLYNKVCDINSPHIYISQKLREVARFLKCIREINPEVQNLSDSLRPRHFRSVILAVKQIAGYNKKTGKYKTPSIPLKIGHSLKKCTFIKLSASIEINNENEITECERFIKLMELEWESEISKNALKTLPVDTWNKGTILPLAEDIVKLNKYLNENMQVSKRELQSNCTKETWDKLCRLAIASLMIFNRKRSGEVSQIELNSYINKQKGSSSSDVESALTSIEREICSNYSRVEIRGKLGKKMPVIFSPNMVEIIDVLVQKRVQIGIDPNNKFLFAYSHAGAINNLRGHTCLYNASRACGAKYPKNLTSTNLRKHIATFSQILNLKEHELDQLARFMSRSINVHRDFYHWPEDVYQLAKVGKLLIALDEGKFEKYKGKSLEEINLDVNEIIIETPVLMEVGGIVHESQSENDFPSGKESSRKRDILEKENVCGANFNSHCSRNGYDELNSSYQSDQTRNEEGSSYNDGEQRRCPIPLKRKKLSPKKERKRASFERHSWTNPEKDIVNNHFLALYKLQKIPGKSEIANFQNSFPAFSKYNWLKVKDLCRREMAKMCPI